ncbi:MAG: alpha/beta hydrolase-fold protein [Candidatus Eisenbacteria bacterium]
MANRVTGVAALVHDGQTFITWNCPSDTGWTYRVYVSNSAIANSGGLTNSQRIATVGDSTWCDHRLSVLCGSTLGFAIDSSAAPLGRTKGLFVTTPITPGQRWYAVTAQQRGSLEDRTISPGVNTLALPVTEILARPRPVYQRTMQAGDCSAAIYTLWTSDRATPDFPAMCNRPGQAYDCSVRIGAPDSPHGLMVISHQYGGGFYPPACFESGDWVLKMDDLVAEQDPHDFWFGYAKNYDITSLSNTPPASDVVEDYTDRRLLFTLEWARRNFPVDTTRVYAAGGSMGGICSVFLAMRHPELIAAAWANIPLVNFSFQQDPNTLAGFNEGNPLRQRCDRLWGTVSTGLRMADGTQVFDRLNAGSLAASLESRFVPPIFMFNGRNDGVVGWAEKIPFYRDMRDHRAGGTFYWDRRDHYGYVASAWSPMMNYGIPYIYRFRSNLSFPAFSNCSADANPGDGTATNGDSVGTINGFLDWDPVVADEPGRWVVNLSLRNPISAWGPVVAPESLSVDVTPRRLQLFGVTPGMMYGYRVVRTSDAIQVQSGTLYADGLGVLTIPAVRVYRSGSALSIGSASVDADFSGLPAITARPMIAPVPSPISGPCPLEVTWARGGNVSIDLLDLAGRRVELAWRGRVAAGRQRLRLEFAGVPSGSYTIMAREGEAIASRRIVLLR